MEMCVIRAKNQKDMIKRLRETADAREAYLRALERAHDLHGQMCARNRFFGQVIPEDLVQSIVLTNLNASEREILNKLYDLFERA